MHITGLILAGGRATRMGSVDKGLQPLHGKPLVAHVIERLAPQIDGLIINANRNLARYRALGLPLCTDEMPDFGGPLAGLQTGLRHCPTPLMMSAPCDSPFLPEDLVQRLHHALLQQHADLAIAVSKTHGIRQHHPVFCLVKKTLLPSLNAYLYSGGRQMRAWQDSQNLVRVEFADQGAFSNINTLQELQRLDAECVMHP